MAEKLPKGESPDEANLLLGISRLLGRSPNIDEALGSMLSLMERALGLRHGIAALSEKSSGELRIAASSSPATKQGTKLRLGEGIHGKVFESGYAIEAEGSICVPILSQGSAIGTLGFEGSAENLPSNPHKTFVEETAKLVAEALKLRRKIREDVFAEIEERAPSTPKAECFDMAPDFIGSSDAMREVFALISRVADTEATVLIMGETGTGKELAARELHGKSKRAAKPFVKVNCAALPESIIESELFGHEKGSFTGAAAMRKGRFELADTGTIFLDEIGEVPLPVQAKLLRVLQEREFERVGGSETVRTDVRVLAATNRDLEKEMAEGKFREDLYWRLNVFPIRIPPLRERRSEITLLADAFTEKYARKHGKEIKRISSPAIDLLTSYHWPGNVRELENCIERAVILSADSVIHSYHLPPSLQSAESTDTAPGSTLDAAVSRLEKEMIVDALKLSNGNSALAARRLGVTERQIGLRIHRYGINWRLYRTKM